MNAMDILAGRSGTAVSHEGATPEALRRRQLSGDLLQPGERVGLVSTDETVTYGKIGGGAIRIQPIDPDSESARPGPLPRVD